MCKEFPANATAMAVAKGAAKDLLYLNAWYCGNLAIAVTVAANSDTAFAQFYKAAKSLAWNFLLDKNRGTNRISLCCIMLVTGIQLYFAHPENHMEILLVILFFQGRNFMLSKLRA